jgi:glycosyltransferase involved in cell wall biosynthesis
MPANSDLESTAPRVSVLIPLYNAALFIAEALESIRAQTVPVQEVIVVDDGSTDGGAEIAATFPFVILVRKEHSGISKTLNLAVEKATGNYFAFLDADDRWLPEKIALQLAAFREDPGLDLVFGHSRRFKTSGPARTSSEVVIDVLPGVSKSCLCVKRSSFERIGLFPEAEVGHDFLDWYLRAGEIGSRSKILPEILMERRIHPNNHGTINKDDQRRNYLGSLKAGLDRRRAARASK